ncbi:uncharacterized protein LOC143249683 [Tachypleus tridentatus]|uniref:uncharacterized protein LOC143249683 n=1 Tax=Tachypleus tridentatus TaxID=6853 RepID=UPI003FD51A31
MESHVLIIFVVVITYTAPYITSAEDTGQDFTPRTVFYEDQDILVILQPIFTMMYPDFSLWNFLGLRSAKKMPNWNTVHLYKNHENSTIIGRENKIDLDDQFFGVVLQFAFPFSVALVPDYKDPETNHFQETQRSLHKSSASLSSMSVSLPSGENLSLMGVWNQNWGKMTICQLLNSYKDKSSIVELLLHIMRLIPDTVREDLRNVLPEDINVMMSAFNSCG